MPLFPFLTSVTEKPAGSPPIPRESLNEEEIGRGGGWRRRERSSVEEDVQVEQAQAWESRG